MTSTSAECPRTSLVEAFHDGRLGPQERASMERHVATCSTCASLLRDLARIGEAIRAPKEPATPLEHQRARLGLLQRAAARTGGREPRQSPPRAFLFAAAAVFFAVLIGFAFGRVSAPERVAFASRMAAAPRVALPRETNIKPSDDARFSRKHDTRLDVVTLEHGSLDVTLRPLASGERFVVRTSDAEIEVRGTALRVSAEGGKIRSVTAVEGTVEVQYAGFVAVIPSGGSWRATSETNPAKADFSSSSNAAPVAASAPALAPLVSRTAVRMPVKSRVKEAPNAVPSSDEPVMAPKTPPSETGTTRVASSSSRAFADAMGSLRRGDYESSAAELDRFALAYPGDARADEALYLRAIALQRAGRSSEAKAAAKQYLASRPNGAHRAEAKLLAEE